MQNLQQLNGWQNAALLMARIFLAGLFFQDAIYNKIVNSKSSLHLMSQQHMPFPQVLLISVIAFEFVTATLLLLGVYGRVVAVLLLFFTLIVTLVFHRFWTYQSVPDIQNQLNHFMKNFAIMGGALYIIVFGTGKFSLH